MAAWRYGARAKTAGLQLRAAEENAPRRAALGAVGETGRAETDGRGCVVARDAQDKVAAHRAGQAECGEVRAARISWGEPQPGTREPQPRRREARGAQRVAALRRSEARLARALEGCSGAA